MQEPALHTVTIAEEPAELLDNAAGDPDLSAAVLAVHAFLEHADVFLERHEDCSCAACANLDRIAHVVKLLAIDLPGGRWLTEDARRRLTRMSLATLADSTDPEIASMSQATVELLDEEDADAKEDAALGVIKMPSLLRERLHKLARRGERTDAQQAVFAIRELLHKEELWSEEDDRASLSLEA